MGNYPPGFDMREQAAYFGVALSFSSATAEHHEVAQQAKGA